MKYLLGLYLIFIPLFYWIGKEIRPAQEMAYQLAGMVLFFALMFCKKRRVVQTKVSLWLGIFALWTMFLYCVAQCTIGFNYLYNVFIFMIVYFVTISCYEKKNFKFLSRCILFVFFLNAVYVASQAWGYDIVGFRDWRFHEMIPKDTGILALPAHWGIYTAIAICMFASRRPFMALLLFPFLYSSKSTGALAAAIIGYLFILWTQRHTVRVPLWYLWIKKEKWFVEIRKIYIPYFFFVFIILGTLGSYYVIKVDQPMGMFSTRPPAWGIMINDALKKPLWGWGLDALRQGDMMYVKYAQSNATVRAIRMKDNTFAIVEKEAQKYNIPKDAQMDLWDSTHNEYINLLYHFSVVGCVIFGILMYCLWLRLKKVVISPQLASIVGVMIVFLVSSTVQFPMSVARLGSMLPIILGLFIIHTAEE